MLPPCTIYSEPTQYFAMSNDPVCLLGDPVDTKLRVETAQWCAQNNKYIHTLAQKVPH